MSAGRKPRKPLYSVGTWDMDAQAYTPHIGLTVPSVNVPWRGLLAVLRELRSVWGYSCHRRRDASGEHDDNDWSVLVERTDGAAEAEILDGWRR
jgi:hypothetical protein